jgi:hypothetical protein
MCRLFLLAAVSTIVLASAVNAVATARRATASVFFRGHGGNVVCGAFSVSGAPTLIECGTVDQLNPAPPQPTAKRCGGLDFAGNRIRLQASSGPFGFCTGDAGVLARIDSAPRLAYGTTRQSGPFKCTSTVAWLTCTNSSGRGFAISRKRWRPVP